MQLVEDQDDEPALGSDRAEERGRGVQRIGAPSGRLVRRRRADPAAGFATHDPFPQPREREQPVGVGKEAQLRDAFAGTREGGVVLLAGFDLERGAHHLLHRERRRRRPVRQ